MPETMNENPEQGSTPKPELSQPSEPPTGDDFRYQAGPFAGLTAAEAAQKYDQDTGQLHNQYQTLSSQVANYVNTIQQQQQTQAQQSDPDLWITDAAKAEQQLAARLQRQWAQQANTVAQPLYTGQAQLAKAGSKNDPALRTAWTKYGSEIESLMAKIPVQQSINKETWDQAAKIVLSNHIDEIAADRAKELAASMGALETNRGGYGDLPAPSQSAIQQIRESDYGKNHLAHYSDSKLAETAKKMGNSLEEYANMISDNKVISHPKTPGEMTNRDLVRDK